MFPVILQVMVNCFFQALSFPGKNQDNTGSGICCSLVQGIITVNCRNAVKSL